MKTWKDTSRRLGTHATQTHPDQGDAIGKLMAIDQLHKDKLCTNNICFLRGTAIGPFFHTTWICPMLNNERHVDQRIAKTKVYHQHLPDALKEHGWAPKRSADPTVPFWGTKAMEQLTN